MYYYKSDTVLTWIVVEKLNSSGYHKCLLDESGQRRKDTHIHVNMSGTTLRDPPYSEALSAVQVLNKWAQPCMYRGTPSEEPCVLSMWLLFCSGAGMCAAAWCWTMGQFTVDMVCWTNWTGPQRDQFSPAKCYAPPVSRSNGLVWLYGNKNRFQIFRYQKKTPFFSRFTTEAFWNIYLIMKWSTIIKL